MSRPVAVAFIKPDGSTQHRLVVPLWPTRAAKCPICRRRTHDGLPCPLLDLVPTGAPSGPDGDGGEPVPVAEVA